MQFEWDEAKRQQNIKKHGVDLLYAAGIFEHETLTRLDDRADYGEPRFIAIGMVGKECFVVVYTEREDAIRIISAWKGGRLERTRYQESIG